MNKSIILSGSPIVDSMSYVTEEFIQKFSIPKGTLAIWPPERVMEIVKELEIDRIVSGGSAANTARGIAFLGGDAKFIGKYSNDQFGISFGQSLKDYNVTDCCKVQDGMITTTIFCLITPDGERTMLPLYGVSHTIVPEDIDFSLISSSDYLLIDGYQFAGGLVDTTYKLINFAVDNKVKIISSLSNISCVKSYSDHVKYLVERADIVIGNYNEFMHIFEASDEISLFNLLQDLCKLGKYLCFVVTMDENGAKIINSDKSIHFSPKNKDNIIDLTGAGDFFAAGFLYGYLQGKSIEICGEIANILAADVISNVGPVLNFDVKNKVRALVS